MVVNHSLYHTILAQWFSLTEFSVRDEPLSEPENGDLFFILLCFSHQMMLDKIQWNTHTRAIFWHSACDQLDY